MTLTTGREFSSRICTIIFLYIYSFFLLTELNHNLKSYLPYLQRHTRPISTSSLHHCLGKWTQELRLPSNTLSPGVLPTPSRTSSLQEPSFQDQLTLFFVVSSSLPTRNCHSCQKYSSKVNTSTFRSTCTNVGILCLPLWVSISTMKMWPWKCTASGQPPDQLHLGLWAAEWTWKKAHPQVQQGNFQAHNLPYSRGPSQVWTK